MDCSQVEVLLPEYVDDTLDPSARRQIDKHLSTCKVCSAELQEMQSYLRAMSSLDEIKAPADFLAKVHNRIEQPSVWKKLFEKIFMPLRIKVPLELAGVLIATLLVVFTYQHVLLEKETPVAPRTSEAPHPGVPQQVTKFARQNDLDESKRKPRLPAAAPTEGTEPTKLSLILRKDRQDYVKKSSAESSLTAAAPEQEVSRSRSSSVEKVHPQKSEELTTTREHEALSIIRNHTQKADGKVLSVENRPGADEFVLITVQIPAARYPSFLTGLRQLGELKLPAGSGPAVSGSGLVRLQIGLTAQQ